MVTVPESGWHALTVPPTLRLGLLPPTNKPALKLGAVLTGTIPAHPVAANHFRGRTFGLYENDRYKVCGPTAVANHLRMTSGAILGTELVPTQADVFLLYQYCNPSFNPVTGTGDNGVVLQGLLAQLLAHGIGDGNGGHIKPVAYAKVDTDSDPELEAAASIFGAIWGVNLDTAQQGQSRDNPPVWKFYPSAEWGGHAVMNGEYTADSTVDVISWGEIVGTRPGFRRQQLQEAWVVVWPFMLAHPAFQAGVDLGALRSAFRDLTGREIAA